MKVLIKDDEEPQKDHKKCVVFTEEEQLQDMYEAHIKWERDRNTDLAIARQKGIEKGMKIAKKMFEKDFSVNDIIDITGLSGKDESLGLSKKSIFLNLPKNFW